MEEEARETSGNDGVTDQEVPIGPLPLNQIEGGKVCGSVELLSGIFMENGGGGGSRVKGHEGWGEGDGWRCQVTIRSLVLPP